MALVQERLALLVEWFVMIAVCMQHACRTVRQGYKNSFESLTGQHLSFQLPGINMLLQVKRSKFGGTNARRDRSEYHS